MNAAVIGECAHRVKFEFELRAAVEHAGVPHPRRIARGPGSGAVKTGIPDPIDLVAWFDRDVGRRKIIAARPDVNVKALRQGSSAAKQTCRGDQGKGGITRE